MKIYAIRDRLIDYFDKPFVAEHDKAVMGGVAATINNPNNEAPISHAPQHFELWELGTVDDDGHIVATRQIICNLAQLVRQESKHGN